MSVVPLDFSDRASTIRMKKWTRRLSISGITLPGIAIVLAFTALKLMRGTPDWYQPLAASPQQREAAAQRATDKLVLIQNQAARARADERAPAPATRAADAIEISLADDELNALVEKWSVWQNVKTSYERFISEPRIVIQDGRIILAGQFKELDTVASLHFEPRIDPDGRVRLRLVRILAGKLPVPQSLVSKYQQRAVDGLTARLPAWRKNAAIDASGIANSSAISAVLGELLINLLQQRPAEPVLFVRLFQGGTMPVRVSDVKIVDHHVNLIVHPMTRAERDALLEKTRDGSALASDEK
jgi:uncharacterized protein YpmS